MCCQAMGEIFLVTVAPRVSPVLSWYSRSRETAPQTPDQGLCGRDGGIMNSPRPSRSNPRPSGTIVSSIVIVMSFVNKAKSLEYQLLSTYFPRYHRIIFAIYFVVTNFIRLIML
jgi:hypothetical protein